MGEMLSLFGEDEDAFAEDLHAWAMERCRWRERCYTGVAHLHRGYRRWATERRVLAADLPQFRAWLVDQGFAVSEATVYGMEGKR